MKMKTTETCLIISSVLCLALTACKTSPSIPQQITSLNVDCKTQDVQILDESEALNGEHTWIAKCKGKSYSCNYLPESDAGCYELSE